MKDNGWILFAILILTACAGQDAFKDGFDEEKTWTEIQTQLPAYPEPDNLLPFDMGSAYSSQHYVDATSIQVGADGVIRYSLIIESSSGAMNVSYEGLRCETEERKRYALGRDDGTWTQFDLANWQLLKKLRQDAASRELLQYYFCPFKSIVGSPEEAINALKAGMHPSLRSLHN